MTLDSWITRLAAANNEGDVLGVVREFLAALPRGFLGGLPPACQPPDMESAQDVSSYAFVLMDLFIAKDSDAALTAMSRFFAAASQRASIILTPHGRFTPRPLDFG